MKSLQVLLLLLSNGLFAQIQLHQVKGSITDSLNQSVPGATVAILSLKDSAIITSVSSNKDGSFILEFSQSPPLILKISHSSFQPNFISIQTSEPIIDAGIVQLLPKSSVLGVVTLVGRKSAVEFRADKTVVNVDASLSNTGATILEV